MAKAKTKAPDTTFKEAEYLRELIARRQPVRVTLDAGLPSRQRLSIPLTARAAWFQWVRVPDAVGVASDQSA